MHVLPTKTWYHFLHMHIWQRICGILRCVQNFALSYRFPTCIRNPYLTVVQINHQAFVFKSLQLCMARCEDNQQVLKLQCCIQPLYSVPRYCNHMVASNPEKICFFYYSNCYVCFANALLLLLPMHGCYNNKFTESLLCNRACSLNPERDDNNDI